jgi:hypothetical protein
VKLTIEISQDTKEAIQCFLGRQHGDANTHGPLTLRSLAEMLMHDVALSERRPGSWEGSKMGDLLSSHGYQA